MKKALFVGWGGTVRNVYGSDTVAKMKELLEFGTDHVIAEKEFDEYRKELGEAEYIFSTWGMPALTAEQIKEYLPKLRAVFYAAGTVQKFARPFLELGIEVHSAWAANAVPVAEYTFAQIVLASKGYFQRLHRQSLGPAWPHRDVPVEFTGNYDLNVGIIGAGMIGKLVIERLKTLDRCRVLVFDPFLPDETAEKLGVEKTDLETVFAECAIISNHLADNEQTRGMLCYRHFSLMKPGSVFINTGRGAQVVEEDLIKALEEDPTRAALLDVTMPEPPEPDSKLYTLDNVFLTPHIAGSLGYEVHRMAEYMYEECRLLESGLPTRYSVSLKMLETMA